MSRSILITPAVAITVAGAALDAYDPVDALAKSESAQVIYTEQSSFQHVSPTSQVEKARLRRQESAMSPIITSTGFLTLVSSISTSPNSTSIPPSASSTVSAPPTEGSGAGFSTGMAVGVGVGCAFGGAFLIGIVAWWCMPARRKNSPTISATAPHQDGKPEDASSGSLSSNVEVADPATGGRSHARLKAKTWDGSHASS